MLPLDRKEIARLSRDRPFLVRLSVAIVLTSAVLALLLSLFFSDSAGAGRGNGDVVRLVEQWSRAVSDSAPDTLENRIERIRFGRAVDPGAPGEDCTDLVFPRQRESGSEEPNPDTTRADQSAPPEPDSPLPDAPTKAAIEALRLGIVDGNLSEALSEIEALPGDLRYRNEFRGDLLFLSEDLESASEAYLAETAIRPESRYAARSAVMAAWRDVDRDRLRELLDTPVTREALGVAERLRAHADARDYAGLLLATVEYEIASFALGSVLPSLGIAALWFLILSAFWEPDRTRVLAALGAFLLGILSAMMTLFVVVLQERVQGFDFSTEAAPISQFLYFVVGVGLREETLKLLCFLPAAWWANRRGSDIEGMVLAAMVGLGFAFKENILYLETGLNSYIGWVRFLTANVLHFSLTGVAGFYLFRMLRRRGRGWEEFLASFIAVVLAHGAYNSILAMPTLISYSPLSPILIAIFAYRFFDPLRGTMDVGGIGRRISPLGIFVIGSVLMTCVVLLGSSVEMPYRFALGAFFASVAGMLPLSFAFISRFRDL